MKHKGKKVSVAVTMLVLAVLACQPGPAPAQTFIVTVQLVTPPTAILPSQTATAVRVIYDVTAPPTFTLEVPTILPTDTFIPSPTAPIVSVSVATNCRTGPGREYDRIMVADVGLTYEVIGKYTPDNYWIINMPNGGQCWLWGEYASPAGNVSSLPELIPPPPPTPALGAITGTITSLIDGSTISNAVVTAQLSNVRFTTDSNGTYFIGNLPSGPEFLTVDAPSYNKSYRSVTIRSNTVTEDFSLNNFSLYVDPASVEGIVLLNTSPASDVTVRIWSHFGGVATTVTDRDGRYRFDISMGQYLLVAELGDWRGAVEVTLDKPMTVAPNITLLRR